MTPTTVTDPNQPSPGLSIAAAAALSGCHKNTVRRWIKQGRLPATLVKGKYGQEYQVKRDDVLALRAPEPEAAGDDQGAASPALAVEVVSGEDTPGRQGLAGEITPEDTPGRQELVGEVTPEVEQGVPDNASPDKEFLSSLVGLLRTVQEENRQLAGQVGFLQSENGQLKTQLKQLQAPPAAPPASTADEPASAEQHQRPAGRPRRWRLLRWLWRADR